MDKIFYQGSIVVIDASDKPDNLAANIIANLHEFGYNGDIHAVGLQGGSARHPRRRIGRGRQHRRGAARRR